MYNEFAPTADILFFTQKGQLQTFTVYNCPCAVIFSCFYHYLHLYSMNVNVSVYAIGSYPPYMKIARQMVSATKSGNGRGKTLQTISIWH